MDVGDRVRIKERGLPDLRVNVGWKGAEPAEGADAEAAADARRVAQLLGRAVPDIEREPIEETWTQHYGGLPAVVDVVDPTNGTIRLRGRDRDGQDFTLEIDPKYVVVTRAALDFDGEA